WGQGGRRAGGSLRDGARQPGLGARCAARIRQYVGGHGALRAGARARSGSAGPLPHVRARARLQRRVPAARRSMTLLRVLLLLVVVARLAELVLAWRNTQRLLAAGAVETGRGHYPLMIALHAAWLVILFVAVPADAAPRWGWLAFFLFLQLARVWVMASLGRF